MENIIEVKNLTKKFNKFIAVDNISFEIKKGEIFGFLGPNGAGKSTTIRILTTLLQPSAGEINISGFDLKKDPDDIRKQIGLVAEKIILYDRLTARENLKFFGQLFHLSKQEIEERTKKWVDRLDMAKWLDAQVGTYSTGMKQRINIVRALLTEPNILFLDEPTLGLDPQTSNLIREFIQELNKKGITILLTTHDMLEADILSNRIAIIDHGKIVALDNSENLKKLVTDKENPTLQDVFLKVTGTQIRDNADGKVAPSDMHRFGDNKNRVR
ncbi:MAG: ATP-binding cassette domain-containing protein [Patescibacteria group bacterium]|nr:ATP-binding cassette domain-containing protein [Patescibacteria group bacterium]